MTATIDISQLKIGDWIVHRNHGIGQIKGKRTSHISGEPTTYYEVATVDSTIWIPMEQLDGDLVRPVASGPEMDEVVAVLRRPPRKLAANFNTRKSLINQVVRGNMPISMARLIRDLRGRQKRRGSLSNTEQQALRSLTKKLINEWAVSRGVSVERARLRLDRLLKREPRQPASGGNGVAAPTLGINALSRSGASRAMK